MTKLREECDKTKRQRGIYKTKGGMSQNYKGNVTKTNYVDVTKLIGLWQN